MVVQSTEVIGTTRSPDGHTGAPIDGLVVQGHPRPTLLALKLAIQQAQAGQLWTTSPTTGQRARVVPNDANGDGLWDSLTTSPDSTTTNNLLSLKIWDRQRRVWVAPRLGH